MIKGDLQSRRRNNLKNALIGITTERNQIRRSRYLFLRRGWVVFVRAYASIEMGMKKRAIV